MIDSDKNSPARMINLADAQESADVNLKHFRRATDSRDGKTPDQEDAELWLDKRESPLSHE